MARIADASAAAVSARVTYREELCRSPWKGAAVVSIGWWCESTNAESALQDNAGKRTKGKPDAPQYPGRSEGSPGRAREGRRSRCRHPERGAGRCGGERDRG